MNTFMFMVVYRSDGKKENKTINIALEAYIDLIPFMYQSPKILFRKNLVSKIVIINFIFLFD